MAQGDPYDRGDSDAYYGRPRSPHKWEFPNGGSRFPFRVSNLTPDEIAEYYRGYDENPNGRKDWG